MWTEKSAVEDLARTPAQQKVWMRPYILTKIPPIPEKEKRLPSKGKRNQNSKDSRKSGNRKEDNAGQICHVPES